MKITVEHFPDEATSIYQKQRMEKMDIEIQTAKQFSQEKLDSMKNSQHITETSPKDLWTGLCGGLGVLLSFVVCIPIIGEGLIISFVSWIITLALGAFLDSTFNAEYAKLVENQKQSSERNITAENARCEATIQRIRDSAEVDCARYSENYQRLFDKQVQYQSLKLSKSASVKSIADWMTAGFARMIDSADRRIYVEQIEIPYSFKVYAHKIECPSGTFDFVKERKKNLNGPVEQAALAVAVASAIQTNIVMQYPHDKSGTNIVVNISPYSSDYGAAMIRMTYSAPNGNFVRLEDW